MGTIAPQEEVRSFVKPVRSSRPPAPCICVLAHPHHPTVTCSPLGMLSFSLFVSIFSRPIFPEFTFCLLLRFSQYFSQLLGISTHPQTRFLIHNAIQRNQETPPQKKLHVFTLFPPELLITHTVLLNDYWQNPLPRGFCPQCRISSEWIPIPQPHRRRWCT